VSLLLLVLIVPVVRRGDAPLALVTVAAFALLVSPTSWSHHWVWIAPALVVTVSHALRERSAGWAWASAVLVVAFYVAPFRFLPHDSGRELGWNGWEQLAGATYVIVAIALLVAAWWHYGPRRQRHPVAAGATSGG